jgi:hypothetical protein
MSLDVYLTRPGPQKPAGSGIFIRESGQTRELTREEWDEKFPGREPVVAPSASDDDGEVYSANITHNLATMAEAASIYDALWRPDEHGLTKAHQLIEPLRAGLAKLRADPQHFEQFNSPNGWGLYKYFVPFVAAYLSACEDYPDADVSVSR